MPGCKEVLPCPNPALYKCADSDDDDEIREQNAIVEDVEPQMPSSMMRGTIDCVSGETRHRHVLLLVPSAVYAEAGNPSLQAWMVLAVFSIVRRLGGDSRVVLP